MKKISFLMAVLIVAIACKHTLPDPIDPGNPGTGSGRPCNVDSVYFTNDILPILNSNCAMSGCHDAITHKDDVELTGYNKIRKEVDPGRASESKLYKVLIEKIDKRMPPLPMAALSPAQITMIRTWINQGAKNNSCDRCDTTNSKYSTAIAPIILLRCQGCHNATNVGGGIDLSSYQGAAAVAVNGKLYGSVNHGTGYSPMPKAGPKMPACEITQIKKWVDSGAPNN